MSFLCKVVRESGQDSAWTSPREGVSGMPIKGRDPGADPGHAEEIISLGLLMNT